MLSDDWAHRPAAQAAHSKATTAHAMPSWTYLLTLRARLTTRSDRAMGVVAESVRGFCARGLCRTGENG